MCLLSAFKGSAIKDECKALISERNKDQVHVFVTTLYGWQKLTIVILLTVIGSLIICIPGPSVIKNDLGFHYSTIKILLWFPSNST